MNNDTSPLASPFPGDLSDVHKAFSAVKGARAKLRQRHQDLLNEQKRLAKDREILLNMPLSLGAFQEALFDHVDNEGKKYEKHIDSWLRAVRDPHPMTNASPKRGVITFINGEDIGSVGMPAGYVQSVIFAEVENSWFHFIGEIIKKSIAERLKVYDTSKESDCGPFVEDRAGHREQIAKIDQRDEEISQELARIETQLAELSAD